jgi:hypothetical protein
MALSQTDLKEETFASKLIELQSIIDNSLMYGHYEKNDEFIVIEHQVDNLSDKKIIQRLTELYMCQGWTQFSIGKRFIIMSTVKLALSSDDGMCP